MFLKDIFHGVLICFSSLLFLALLEFFEVAYIASGLSLHWSEYDCEGSNFSFSKVDFFINRLNVLVFYFQLYQLFLMTAFKPLQTDDFF